MIAITLRMLFMLQKHWTGKLKAIVVFALRLPSVPSIPHPPSLCTLLPDQTNHHLINSPASQHNPHRHLPPPRPPLPPLDLRPSPRPHDPHSLDTRRNGLQPRNSNHTNPHALPGEAEHRPRSFLPGRLHPANHASRVLQRRQLRDAVVEEHTERKSGTFHHAP